MAKLDDDELVALIEEAIDRYVTSHSVNPGNVCESVARIIVQALHGNGVTAVRDERRTGAGSDEPVPLRRGSPLPV
jgi:hypothetical protein